MLKLRLTEALEDRLLHDKKKKKEEEKEEKKKKKGAMATTSTAVRSLLTQWPVQLSLLASAFPPPLFSTLFGPGP